MRRPVARLSSLAWFIMTAGVGAVLLPWWLTQWRVQPHPHVGLTFVAGAVLIVLALIPPINVSARYARAGGTPMRGAMTTELVVTGFNGYVRNPIYLGALMTFVGEAVLLGRSVCSSTRWSPGWGWLRSFVGTRSPLWSAGSAPTM